MFEDWCVQHDKHIVDLNRMGEMSAKYTENSQKPILPAEEIIMLKKHFKEIDRDGSGLITADELMLEFGFSHVDSVRELLAENDISGDACVDESEYIMMM